MNNDSELMIVSDELTLNNLNALLDKQSKVLAIWVKGYIAEDVCNKIAKVLTENDLLEKYSFTGKEIPVARLGMTLGEVWLDPSLKKEYFRKAAEIPKMIRNVALPYLGSVDKLILDLDAIWPKGITTPEIDGKRISAGTYRAVMPGGKIAPHQDNLKNAQEILSNDDETLTPTEKETKNLVFAVKDLVFADKDLGSNVYLQVPKNSGGEFQVWDHAPTYGRAAKENYGISEKENDDDTVPTMNDRDREHHIAQEDYEKLDTIPSVTIQPNVGDLIIFNPANIHQVKELENGVRISSSMHIAYRGQDEKLICWS